MADLAENVERLLDEARDIAARVDDGVEGAAFERAEVVVAVAAQLLDLGEELGPRLPAVEQRDLVAPLECDVDGVAAEELRAAENQDAHTLTLC